MHYNSVTGFTFISDYELESQTQLWKDIKRN